MTHATRWKLGHVSGWAVTVFALVTGPLCALEAFALFLSDLLPFLGVRSDFTGALLVAGPLSLGLGVLLGFLTYRKPTNEDQ